MEGGFLLRYILIAIMILLTAFIIKEDLMEGSLKHTDFYATNECDETSQIEKVSVKIQQGDTIHSLFAATASPDSMLFIDRLTLFYELNPHLRVQTLVIGETIYIPIKKTGKQAC